MNGCSQFGQTSPACKTIQVIEPDATLLTLTSSGSSDQSLDESGSTPLPALQPTAQVVFQTVKASANYRFEYLYVDDAGDPNSGSVVATPILMTTYGFTVNLVGLPMAPVIPGAGYVLRWRVVVVDAVLEAGIIDAPESLRDQLTQGVQSHSSYYINARSSADYGFSEMRVENLIDDPASQIFIFPQVVAKTTAFVTVQLSNIPPTPNYYLVVRTP
jgi:hypothetical protein